MQGSGRACLTGYALAHMRSSDASGRYSASVERPNEGRQATLSMIEAARHRRTSGTVTDRVAVVGCGMPALDPNQPLFLCPSEALVCDPLCDDRRQLLIQSH